jgi:hypothetical protein
MYVVALADNARRSDEDVAALAADLSTTVYEARLMLNAGAPAIVLTTPDRARALDALAKLRARGHDAIACDGAAVVGSEAMISMRRFRLDESALVAGERTSEERLPYDDIAVLLPALHRRHVEKHSEYKERKFNVARAVMSGGLVMNKTTTRTTHATSDEREHVLYAFRASGETPWILREHETHYAALESQKRPSTLENFNTVVTLLRQNAPRAVYDDRLMTLRRVPETAKLAGDARARTTTTSSASGVDLMAHLLALWLVKHAPAGSAHE